MRPETPAFRLDRSKPMPKGEVLEAEVLEYSHLGRMGWLAVVVGGERYRLSISAEHLRSAGYATLVPGQMIKVRIGWFVVSQPRVEAIIREQTSRSTASWLMSR